MIRNRHALRRERTRERFSRTGRASQRVQQAKRMEREPDADTLLRRAQHDARGQVIREGRTYTASGVTHWQVVRSVVGQYRQYDVIVDGQLWRTGGPRKLAKWLKVPRRIITA